MTMSMGKKFREALQEEQPLQIVGVINAYAAMMAKDIGYRAIYLSGAGVANSSYGLPDLGATTLDNVLEDTKRIISSVDLPLLVDIDTGWGNPLMIKRAIQALIRAGAAAIHIEDQTFEKKCGHLSDKQIVPKEEMVERIKAAVNARTDPDFIIMARTDAFDSEGLLAVIERCKAYRNAGADMLFPEALVELDHYKAVKEEVGLPILANITEFGKTPLYTLEELKSAGVDMALYPLSANRSMNHAAQKVLKTIREEKSQKTALPTMQTREELYRILNYTHT